ncbi:MAG: hypothetical protein ACK5KR_06610 [Breznakia sp.]
MISLSLFFVILAMAAPAYAATVYYRGSAVSWDYGRSLSGLWAYSSVQSGIYSHSATINTTFSGWKKPGKKRMLNNL